jgi:hypothetical protein
MCYLAELLFSTKGADLLSSSLLSSSESLSNARMMKGPVVRPKSAVTDNSRHDTLQKCNSRIKQESHPSVLTFLLSPCLLAVFNKEQTFCKEEC